MTSNPIIHTLTIVIALTSLLFVAAARSAPERASTCRYCHPVACLTSAFCGEGCSCLKTDGASSGQCVPR